jgi:hydrogenase expression/formation protein HypC
MCLAIPGQITKLTVNDTNNRLGKVDFGGVTREVLLVLVPHAKIGDFVLVHAGCAISVVDPVEAEESLNYIRQIAEAES